MATFKPIDMKNPQEVKDWMDWANTTAAVVHGKPEVPNVTDQDYDSSVFKTPEGDVSAAKTLLGVFIANLSGQEVTID